MQTYTVQLKNGVKMQMQADGLSRLSGYYDLWKKGGGSYATFEASEVIWVAEAGSFEEVRRVATMA